MTLSEKKCPRCGLTNNSSATECLCGYNFETGKKPINLGKFLLIVIGIMVGIALMVFAILNEMFKACEKLG